MSAKVALVHREDWPYPDWVGEELTAAGINFVRRDCESEAETLNQHFHDTSSLCATPTLPRSRGQAI